jgi:mannose-6-phosphate isomerase-like protein (cupin superfamily)
LFKDTNLEKEGHMEVVNLNDKLAKVKEYWSPKIVGELNDTYVKIVKFTGEFVWHHHDNEDELFLVVKGRLLMKFRDREEIVKPGSLLCRRAWSICQWRTRKLKWS